MQSGVIKLTASLEIREDVPRQAAEKLSGGPSLARC